MDGSVAVWGQYAEMPENQPSNNTNFLQVSTGANYFCGLKKGGSVYCWGSNNFDQATPPADNSNFLQISTGMYHTCGVRTDGTTTCWGSNIHGPGEAPAVSFTPTKLPNGAYNASYSHTLTASGGITPYTFSLQRRPSRRCGTVLQWTCKRHSDKRRQLFIHHQGFGCHRDSRYNPDHRSDHRPGSFHDKRRFFYQFSHHLRISGQSLCHSNQRR
jgi:hypothetical protein